VGSRETKLGHWGCAPEGTPALPLSFSLVPGHHEVAVLGHVPSPRHDVTLHHRPRHRGAKRQGTETSRTIGQNKGIWSQ
jgi:hypothetical protein